MGEGEVCVSLYHSFAHVSLQFAGMGFEYRRLIVYQKVLQYRALAARLLVRIKLVDVDLHNQLKRNGNSIGSNIAEGASEDRPKVKADRYRVAKREAEEAGMNWESAVASGYLADDEIEPLLQVLDETSRMLAALIRRFDQEGSPRKKDGEPPPPPPPIPIPPPSS